MDIFFGFGIGMLFVFIFLVIIGGIFMWIAAKIARVEKSSFGRAIVAAVACSFIPVVVSFAFNFFPIVGNLIGFIIGLILTIVVIKASFDTTFSKALLVWIFYLIAALGAVVVAAMITASSLIFA